MKSIKKKMGYTGWSRKKLRVFLTILLENTETCFLRHPVSLYTKAYFQICYVDITKISGLDIDSILEKLKSLNIVLVRYDSKADLLYMLQENLISSNFPD